VHVCRASSTEQQQEVLNEKITVLLDGGQGAIGARGSSLQNWDTGQWQHHPLTLQHTSRCAIQAQHHQDAVVLITHSPTFTQSPYNPTCLTHTSLCFSTHLSTPSLSHTCCPPPPRTPIHTQ
jgi:hypothetical protein